MIDPKWIISRNGNDYPRWPGVLDAATKAGLKSLTTRVIQIPNAENGHVAVVMARAEFEDGRVFEDVGDASPANCSVQIATAALRMASTRAKGRALRDALNVGMTMFEELPDMTATVVEIVERPALPGQLVDPGLPPSIPTACQECGLILNSSQQKLSEAKYGRILCPADQKKVSSNGQSH